MQQEVAKGYNLLVSTNAGRFTCAVLLDLSKRLGDSASSGFMIHQDDWYESFRESLGLDSAAVPEYVDLQRVHHQCKYVLPVSGVIAEEGPTPRAVLQVWSGWPPGAGIADEYTFVDTAASPDMEVTNEQCIHYWILDYGDLVVNDQIVGLRGRPLEGALGVAFKVVGSGAADWSRAMVSAAGELVTYSRAARGPFAVKVITTTSPSGRMVKGLPKDRPDLEALEERLQKPLKVRYPDAKD